MNSRSILGLSLMIVGAGIIIVAASHLDDRTLGTSEASLICYSTMRTIIDNDLPGAAEARKALADGFLSRGEYDAVIAVGDAAEEKEYEADREYLKARARKGEFGG